MANKGLNDMKGRLAEIIADGGDLIVVPMSGLDADDTFEDGYADAFLTTVLGAAGNTEQTGSTWVRKVHLSAAITEAVDDTANLWRIILDSDDTWVAVVAGNDVVALLICEDAGSDATRRVVGKWDFAVTTDGNDVVANYDQSVGIWTAA